MARDPEARRARIVCTLGPATQSPEAVEELVRAGMDVARLNLSHGSHEGHAERVAQVRRAAARAGRNVAVLADLQGPRIRLGVLEGGEAVLEAGAELVLDTAPEPGTAHRIATSHPALHRDVGEGDAILVDDGRLRLEVLEAKPGAVRTRVVTGGRIRDRRGMNLPGSRVSLPALTPKDVRDLDFALDCGADWIALSFVRGAEDAGAVRERMRARGRLRPVLAKIEKPQAVDALEPIAEAFDGIMVARGDLGVELPLERIPAIQRRAIDAARARARPAVVATQMLESMVQAPRPTRAEVSDVATAVRDGADALMLSAETSIGRHPTEAVRMMSRVICAAEATPGEPPSLSRDALRTPGDVIAEAAVHLARQLDAAAVCSFTVSGTTARRIARHRPRLPVVALSPDSAVERELALVWGVEALHAPAVEHVDPMIDIVERTLLGTGRFAEGDTVVLVAGTPVGVAGRTNLLRVHRLGEDRDGGARG